MSYVAGIRLRGKGPAIKWGFRKVAILGITSHLVRPAECKWRGKFMLFRPSSYNFTAQLDVCRSSVCQASFHYCTELLVQSSILFHIRWSRSILCEVSVCYSLKKTTMPRIVHKTLISKTCGGAIVYHTYMAVDRVIIRIKLSVARHRERSKNG